MFRGEGGARRTHYLRPPEAEEFSEAIRRNLVNKYRLIHGTAPGDDRMQMLFDVAYLARSPHGGTRKARIKGVDVIGAFCPFEARGSAELLQTMWDCGAGEKNGSGFGMVERSGR